VLVRSWLRSRAAWPGVLQSVASNAMDGGPRCGSENTYVEMRFGDSNAG
jgi:hypothetical protein